MPKRLAVLLRRRWVLILLGGWLLAPGAGAWTLETMLDVARLPAAAPSPDGERIAYVVSRADLDVEPSRYRGHLHVAAADGTGSRQYTFGQVHVSQPRWSPDGRWLAYLAAPDAGPTALALIAADGGGSRVLTDGAGSVQDFQWSPRGDAIALLRAEPAAAADPVAITGGGPEPGHHLWHLALDDTGNPTTVTPLTRGDFNVGSPLLGGSFDWSPDGRRIAFTRTRSAALDDWTSSDIAIVDVGSGEVRAFQQSNAAEFAPHFSPDGRRIAFSISMFPPSWIRQQRVGVAEADGSGSRVLAVTPDEQPRIVGWLGERALLVEEPAATVTGLWTLPVDGGRPRRLDDGTRVLDAVTLNASATQLAFSVADSDSPPAVATTALRRFRPKVVAEPNRDLPSLPAAETRLVSWTAADGLEIEGLLTLPAGHRRGQRHPLVLLVHGGPALAHQRTFLGEADPLQPLAAFAARGYATLRVNPRGSSGYGHAFRAANRSDWGGADFDDLMAGLDHVVELGVADPQRLAVTGWSYGGYMTTLLVTRNHRFGAAVAGAPVTDLLQLAVTTDIPGFLPDYLDGGYWAQPDFYRERSPLHLADHVTTPVLVLHGAADPRVPPSQGRGFYQALVLHGQASRFVGYPRAGHVLSEPRQILHAARETLAWIERHVPVE